MGGAPIKFLLHNNMLCHSLAEVPRTRLNTFRKSGRIMPEITSDFRKTQLGLENNAKFHPDASFLLKIRCGG